MEFEFYELFEFDVSNEMMGLQEEKPLGKETKNNVSPWENEVLRTLHGKVRQLFV